MSTCDSYLGRGKSGLQIDTVCCLQSVESIPDLDYGSNFAADVDVITRMHGHIVDNSWGF
jgi:hypothetical protein